MAEWCPDLPALRNATWSTAAARSLLRSKWIYLLGDSSLRYVNAALVGLLNGSLADDHFADTLRHHSDPYAGRHHAACGIGETSLDELDSNGGRKPPPSLYSGDHLRDNDEGQSCLREFVSMRHDSSVRITYSFRTASIQKTRALASLISPGQVPDAFVLGTGTWDYHNYGQSTEKAAHGAAALVHSLRRAYPASTIVFANAVDCNQNCGRRSKDQCFNANVSRLLKPLLHSKHVRAANYGRAAANHSRAAAPLRCELAL